VRYTPFSVPGKGRSRNVVGVHQGRRNCLKVVMAHTDSVPQGPGAVDNASGVGVLVGLARWLGGRRARCDVWLVATGAEERVHTGHPDHLGSSRLVRHLRERRSAKRLRYAFSVDMIGRGTRFQLRSPRGSPRPRVEGQVLRAGRREGVALRWLRDSSTGNSDHREFELAGLPAVAIQIWGGTEPCYHSACDTWRRIKRGAVRRVERVARAVLERR
jgi:Zn-dependent M28 family amino/carboxypeptidase